MIKTNNVPVIRCINNIFIRKINILLKEKYFMFKLKQNLYDHQNCVGGSEEIYNVYKMFEVFENCSHLLYYSKSMKIRVLICIMIKKCKQFKKIPELKVYMSEFFKNHFFDIDNKCQAFTLSGYKCKNHIKIKNNDLFCYHHRKYILHIKNILHTILPTTSVNICTYMLFKQKLFNI